VIAATWYALEVVTMWGNPKRRALHDRIAGTVVIRVIPLWRRADLSAHEAMPTD
jgi:uncharacterized RDD family membrane protein YckC